MKDFVFDQRFSEMDFDEKLSYLNEIQNENGIEFYDTNSDYKERVIIVDECITFDGDIDSYKIEEIHFDGHELILTCESCGDIYIGMRKVINIPY